MKSPKIRFKEFQNDWNSRILGDICEYKTSNLSNENIEKKGLYDLYDANGVIGKTNKNPQKENYITIIDALSKVDKRKKQEKEISKSIEILDAVKTGVNTNRYVDGNEYDASNETLLNYQKSLIKKDKEEFSK